MMAKNATPSPQKIALWLNNPSLPNMDYTSIMHGNPGLPGSEYEFLLLSYYLQCRNNGIEPYLFVNFEGTFPHKHVCRANSLDECAALCSELGIGKIVVDVKYATPHSLKAFAATTQIFIWAHNQPSPKMLTHFWRDRRIARIVCVSKSEMLDYKTHPAFLKSTAIYNLFSLDDIEKYRPTANDKNNHNVVWMGCLIEDKGFHVLAQAWKQVLEKTPDAQLFVIGNGRLYDANATLGHYGLASPEYEARFMPFVTNSNGEILQSVHFLGVLGDEKYDIMRRCKVGVPNPTAVSETFCISAIEMQLMGCNVVAPLLPIFEENVMSHSYLFESENDLAATLARSLNDKTENYNALYRFVKSKVDVNANTMRWEQLFTHLPRISLLAVAWYEMRWFLYRIYCWILRHITK